MNNSIETTWKQGFIKESALIAPKINDIYGKKSSHIIDTMKEMFQSNLNAVAIGAGLQLLVLSFIGLPLTGAIILLVLGAIVYFGRKEMRRLETIDKTENCYQYVKHFDHWLKGQITHYARLYRFVYPMFFLSFPIGLWFSNMKDSTLIDLQLMFPDSFLMFGVPLPVVGLITMISIVLAITAAPLYKFEVGLIYGKVLGRLDVLIKDMAELQKE